VNSDKKNRLRKSVLMILAALVIASLRKIPVLSIMPLAVGLIECLIIVCILLSASKVSWQASAIIGVLTPICLWLLRFTDGFMVPVCILSNLTVTGCVVYLLRPRFSYMINVLLSAIPAFCITLLGSAIAIWLVKEETLVRAVIVAWNTGFYSGISLLCAAFLTVPIIFLKARPRS